MKIKWQFWQKFSPLSDPGSGAIQKTTKVETSLKKTQAKTGISRLTIIGHFCLGFWALTSAVCIGLNTDKVQWLERQAQTTMFKIRGQITPPEDIIILAIDEYSMEQGDLFLNDPQNLPFFEPLQQWPWKREAYAIAIKKILDAGAKAVAVDVVFDRPSIYGEADDQKLLQVLKEYPGKITLAAMYDDSNIQQGGLLQLIQPNEIFRLNSVSIGSINYPIEKDGRIHRLGNYFIQEYSKTLDPELAKVFNEDIATIPSFAEAILQAADVEFPQPKGENIFYYGSPQTFDSISFANVLDPENWKGIFKNGAYFQDKIVLIGPTATLHQDFHPTPFSQRMPGIEINANAIATLKYGKAISQAIPNFWIRGILVLAGVTGIGIFLGIQKRWLIRFGMTIIMAVSWAGISYLIFVYDGLILPTAVPILTIMLAGITYGLTGATQELLGKLQLKKTLKYYSSSPLIRKILTEQEDTEFKDVLQEREQDLFSQKLAGRYQIVEQLSSGGFGETFIAEDTLRPGNPRCVVKQLKPLSDKPKVWELARRLFVKEAEILEKLGKHEQIPQLLAYFDEEEEFYLVQELVVGRTFSHEIPIAVPFSDAKVVAFLKDLLPVLDFIHSHGVIHRDIKPDNLMRRKSDRKLVIIDFGTVKEIASMTADDNSQQEKTVAIGTRGYMPIEQLAGTPKFNSDLYALGMVAIETLTLTDPYDLEKDVDTGEVIWEDLSDASPELKAILTKMIRVNYRDRYQTAKEVLADLEPLIANLPDELTIEKEQQEQMFGISSGSEDHTNISLDQETNAWEHSEHNDSTTPWPDSRESHNKNPDEEATFNWSVMVNSLSTELRSDLEDEEDDNTTNPWPESFGENTQEK